MPVDSVCPPGIKYLTEHAAGTLKEHLMRIEMITTGDEIMTGFVTDTNTGYFASRLLDSGLTLTRNTGVGDDMTELISVFRERSAAADIVLVTGGLGPTTDDLTAEAAAAASEKPLTLYPECALHLKKWQEMRGIVLTDNNDRQAYLPKGAEVIPNPHGTACGFKMKMGRAVFYFTPGVPSEFVKMLDDYVLPDIIKASADLAAMHSAPVSVSRFFVFGISESAIGRLISAEKLPQGITVGYRATPGFVEIKVISKNASEADKLAAESMVMKHAGDCLIGRHDEDMLFRELSDLLDAENAVMLIADDTTCGRLGADACRYLPGRTLTLSSFPTEKESGTEDQNPAAEPYENEISAEKMQSLCGKICDIPTPLLKDYHFCNKTCKYIVTASSDSSDKNTLIIKFFDIDKKAQFKRKLLYKGLPERKYLIISFIVLDTMRRYLKNADYAHAYPYFEDIA